MKWHETCKCECGSDASVYNNQQLWDNDKCRCECQELIDKGMCDSSCECECDKSCDVGEYLDYKNCKCRKRLTDKLAEKCSENIDGNKMIYNGILNAIPLNNYGKVCSSCTIYTVLLVIYFIINIVINCVFIYFSWYLKTRYTETTIY